MTDHSTTPDDIRKYLENFTQHVARDWSLDSTVDRMLPLVMKMAEELADQIERVNRLELRLEQAELDVTRVGDTLTEHLFGER